MNRKLNDIDKEISIKLKHVRNLNNLSQIDLANELGISAQQIQKYEANINRISSSRLFQIAEILNVDIKIFFEKCKFMENEY